METMEVVLAFVFLFGILCFVFNTFIAFSVTFVTLAYYLDVPVMVSVLTAGILLVFAASYYVQRKRLLEAFADDMVENTIHHPNLALVKEDGDKKQISINAFGQNPCIEGNFFYTKEGFVKNLQCGYTQHVSLERYEVTPTSVSYTFQKAGSMKPPQDLAGVFLGVFL